jgi:hypothetical protein
MVVSATLGVLCGVLALILSGCISGRSDVRYGPEGPAAGHETIRQIEIGQTSREWVLGTLGKPTSATMTPDGMEILKYVYTKKVDSDLDVFLFLDFDEKHEYRTTFYFEIADGVVTNFWKE